MTKHPCALCELRFWLIVSVSYSAIPIFGAYQISTEDCPQENTFTHLAHFLPMVDWSNLAFLVFWMFVFGAMTVWEGYPLNFYHDDNGGHARIWPDEDVEDDEDEEEETSLGPIATQLK